MWIDLCARNQAVSGTGGAGSIPVGNISMFEFAETHNRTLILATYYYPFYA